MKKTGIERLVEYLYQRKKKICTDSAREKARLCLLDELGCGIYGSTMPEARKIINAAKAMQNGGNVPVWGTKTVFSQDIAAFVNGSLCHIRELDDVHYAILHTGAVCVPATLAAAQIQETTYGKFLEALSIGVETMVRISNGMNYLNHRERGWHGTSTCGAFGAAASVGIVLGLTEEEMINALGISGSRTGGTWAFAVDGAMTKRLHPGMAARDGLMSAYLGKEGIKGPHYVLESEDGGFYKLMCDSWNLNFLDEDKPSAMEDIEYKWFASCKSVHSPYSAAAEIFNRNQGKNPRDIKAIWVYVNRSAIEMAGKGYNPESVVSAQISIPYGVSLGLWGHKGMAEDYSEECLHKTYLKKTADLVTVIESEEMNELRKKEKRSAARVIVEWQDGTQDSAFVKAPKGSIFSPLDSNDIKDKFGLLTESIMGAEQVKQIQKWVMEAEETSPICELIDMLGGK